MNKNVPKLRFKEFEDEWKENKLGNIAKIVGGGTPSTVEESYWNGNIKWFTPSEIGKTKYVKFSNRNITELGVKKSSAKILPKGSILLTTRATLGEMAILKSEATTNQGFQSLIVKDGYKNEFIYYLKEKISKYCYKNASGSTFLEISKSNLEKCKLDIPCLKEQEKIADFFTILDRLIEEQDGKVSDLKIYKKGMMQKIFSQEIRFKDENGCDYPEWEEKKLETLILSVSSGKTKEKSRFGLYKVFGSTGIIGYSNNFDYEGENILIARVGANAGTINRCDEKCGISDNTLIIKCKNELMYRFLEYFLINFNLSRLIFGSGQPLITGNQIKNIKINTPCLEEQEKIANVLSNIDNIIEEEQNNLDDLKEMKKGLLQKMFI